MCSFILKGPSKNPDVDNFSNKRGFVQNELYMYLMSVGAKLLGFFMKPLFLGKCWADMIVTTFSL